MTGGWGAFGPVAGVGGGGLLITIYFILMRPCPPPFHSALMPRPFPPRPHFPFPSLPQHPLILPV